MRQKIFFVVQISNALKNRNHGQKLKIFGKTRNIGQKIAKF